MYSAVLVIERTISEAKGQMRLDVVSVHYLDEIAVGQNLALLGAESEKPMQGSLGVVNFDRLCKNRQFSSANQHHEPLEASKN